MKHSFENVFFSVHAAADNSNGIIGHWFFHEMRNHIGSIFSSIFHTERNDEQRSEADSVQEGCVHVGD